MIGDSNETSARPARAPWTRTLQWSVRRELWEHRSIYMAPLIVGGVGLFGFLLSSFWLPRTLRAIISADQAARTADPMNVEAFAAAGKAAAKAAAVPQFPYDFLALIVVVAAAVVAALYCLAALYGERKDRSILFWKSLPVSDLIAVLAKAAVPLIVTPAVILAIILPAHFVMLTWSLLILGANGMSPDTLLSHLPFPYLWLSMVRGLIILALWYAPVAAWLLLASAWAKRMAVLWALGPWVALLVLDRVTVNTGAILGLLRDRLGGGFDIAFTVDARGGRQASTLADLDLTPVLMTPALWIGLAVAAACLIAAVRLRRYREAI